MLAKSSEDSRFPPEAFPAQVTELSLLGAAWSHIFEFRTWQYLNLHLINCCQEDSSLDSDRNSACVITPVM